MAFFMTWDGVWQRLPSIGGLDSTRLWTTAIKTVLSVLLGLIVLTLLIGVVAVGLELLALGTAGVDTVLQHVLIGVLMLLAMVEVFRTTLAYLTEGRVKVTFIVDTILVVMLTEILSLWLKGGEGTTFTLLLSVIAVLSGVRILAIRFSPSSTNPDARRDAD
ncbi:MAG: phosphate-starvation-inducible PsiE family protein [Nitrospirota bacterium]